MTPPEPSRRARNLAPTFPHSAVHQAILLGGAAVAGLVIGTVAVELTVPGPLARHMATHILLMNVVAPLVALASLRLFVHETRAASSRQTVSLLMAMTAQLALLWGWHAPALLPVAMQDATLHAVMQGSLAAVALWFWLEVFRDQGPFRWRALFALLLTGKLFCLLGVLLVFAPRLLYATHPHGSASADALADQHLAGLLMVVACPLSYLLAGVVIASRWLRELAQSNVGSGVPISSPPSGR